MTKEDDTLMCIYGSNNKSRLSKISTNDESTIIPIKMLTSKETPRLFGEEGRAS